MQIYEAFREKEEQLVFANDVLNLSRKVKFYTFFKTFEKDTKDHSIKFQQKSSTVLKFLIFLDIQKNCLPNSFFNFFEAKHFLNGSKIVWLT